MNTKGEKQEANNTVKKVRFLENPPAIIRKPLSLLNDHAYAAVWLYIEVSEETINPDSEDSEHQEPIKRIKRERFIIRDDGTIYGEIDAEGITPLRSLEVKVVLPFIPKEEKLWSSLGLNKFLNGYQPNPCDIYHKIVDVFDKFIDFSQSLASQRETAELVALYTMATWFSDGFNVFGYLWPNGQKGSGKSQVLWLVAEIGYLGEFLLAGSSYATLRDLADYGGTLAFDDAENQSDAGKYDPDKRALLLAGNRKGSQVGVKEQIEGIWYIKYINTYCPRLFSAISLPDPVLASRTIVLPLIRTSDDFKGNSDPLDYDCWPHDRQGLIDDLWALAVTYLPKMPAYSKRVSSITKLRGRNLEPWRAIFGVAAFLEDNGEEGLTHRIAELAWKYVTEEKSRLQEADLTNLIIQALIKCAVDANSASCSIKKSYWFSTREITKRVISVAQDDEFDIETGSINTRVVGSVLGSMRFKAKRPVGSGPRGWVISLIELERWCQVYALSFPVDLVIQRDTGTDGIAGTDGINQQDPIRVSNNDDNGKSQILELCSACGQTAWKERSSELGGGWYCCVCHPLGQQGSEQE